MNEKPSEQNAAEKQREQVGDFLNSPSGAWIIRIAAVLTIFFLVRAVFF